MFESTQRGAILLTANSLQIRLVSSFNCTLAPTSGFEFEVSPGRDLSFDVFEQCDTDDAGGGKHEHADEHPRNVESLARDGDQVA